MDNRINSWGKKLNRGKNPQSDFPGKCAIKITICNSDNATLSLTQEMHRRTQTS